MTQARVFVSGRVQGVSFRASTAEAAAKFSDLRGWVRNLPDDRVEAVFSGESSAVNSMLEWCKKGPPFGRVDHTETIQETPDSSLPLFEIR